MTPASLPHGVWQDPENNSVKRSAKEVSLPLFDSKSATGRSGAKGGENEIVSSSFSPHKIRASKKQQIFDFFAANLGIRFSSFHIHERFGTAVRTRISEINRSACWLVIRNETKVQGSAEHSTYWGEKRA